MGKRFAAVCAALALAAALLSCAGPGISPEISSENALVVHFIDVGQGDAALVRCGDMTMLVDAGTEKSAERLVDFIKKQGISSLDYVVATHPHADHIGGMPLVLESFEVGTFLMPDAVHTTAVFERMLDALAENGASARYVALGMTFSLGEAEVQALSPPEGEVCDNLNNYSAVLSVSGQGRSVLLTGDAEGEVERRIAPGLWAHDILKAGHHGSNTSSTAELLDAVRPEYAVISCGAGNEYGHPHAEVLERMSGINVLRTDLNGTVTFIISGGQIDVRTEKDIRP